MGTRAHRRSTPRRRECGSSASTDRAKAHGPQPLALRYNSLTDSNVLLTPVLAAALNGHAGVLGLLLDAGASPTSSPGPPVSGAPEGYAICPSPPIVAAASAGHLAAVRVLISRTPASSPPVDALLRACSGGFEEVVDLLLSAGVSATTQCLAAASEAGCLGAATALIDAGADANGAVDTPPLVLAAAGGHVDVARKLLAAGAATHARDARGRTPLIAATHAQCEELVEMLRAAQGASEVGAPTQGEGSPAGGGDPVMTPSALDLNGLGSTPSQPAGDPQVLGERPAKPARLPLLRLGAGEPVEL